MIKYLGDGIEIDNLNIPYTLLASCNHFIPINKNGLVARIKRDGIHIKSKDKTVVLPKDIKSYAKARISGDYLLNSSL